MIKFLYGLFNVPGRMQAISEALGHLNYQLETLEKRVAGLEEQLNNPKFTSALAEDVEATLDMEHLAEKAIEDAFNRSEWRVRFY